MKAYLAADIGGSKTRIELYDESGALLHTCAERGYGTAVDSDAPLPTLTTLLSSLRQKAEVTAAVVNLGGKNSEQIRRAFVQGLPGCAVEVYRESQGTAALAFGGLWDAAVVLLAGTGAIAVGSDGEARCVIAGGWGANIGDDGSGYDIGLRAIHEALAALDGDRELTPLQQELTGLSAPFVPCDADAFCQARDAVRKRLAPLDRAHIASYAKMVAAHCQSGEADALAILRDAGIQLAKPVLSVIRKLYPHRAVKLAVSGGLVHSAPYWKDAFEQQLSGYIADVVYAENGVMCGTKELAKRLFEKG